MCPGYPKVYVYELHIINQSLVSRATLIYNMIGTALS